MAYDASATGEHVRHVPSVQSYTLSIPMQIRVVMHRLKGDWATQAVQVGSVFIPLVFWRLIFMNNYRSQMFQAIFTGTVFTQVASNTSAYFLRGSLLYLYGCSVKFAWKRTECCL